MKGKTLIDGRYNRFLLDLKRIQAALAKVTSANGESYEVITVKKAQFEATSKLHSVFVYGTISRRARQRIAVGFLRLLKKANKGKHVQTTVR